MFDINDICLPDYVKKDIDALQAGIADTNCSYVDCLVEELAATINSAASAGDISDEVAWERDLYYRAVQLINEIPPKVDVNDPDFYEKLKSGQL